MPVWTIVGNAASLPTGNEGFGAGGGDCAETGADSARKRNAIETAATMRVARLVRVFQTGG